MMSLCLMLSIFFFSGLFSFSSRICFASTLRIASSCNSGCFDTDGRDDLSFSFFCLFSLEFFHVKCLHQPWVKGEWVSEWERKVLQLMEKSREKFSVLLCCVMCRRLNRDDGVSDSDLIGYISMIASNLICLLDTPSRDSFDELVASQHNHSVPTKLPMPLSTGDEWVKYPLWRMISDACLRMFEQYENMCFIPRDWCAVFVSAKVSLVVKWALFNFCLLILIAFNFYLQFLFRESD